MQRKRGCSISILKYWTIECVGDIHTARQIWRNASLTTKCGLSDPPCPQYVLGAVFTLVLSSCPLGSLRLCFDAKCEQGHRNSDSSLCPWLKTQLVYCSIKFNSVDSLQLFYGTFRYGYWTEFSNGGSRKKALFLKDRNVYVISI